MNSAPQLLFPHHSLLLTLSPSRADAPSGYSDRVEDDQATDGARADVPHLWVTTAETPPTTDNLTTVPNLPGRKSWQEAPGHPSGTENGQQGKILIIATRLKVCLFNLKEQHTKLNALRNTSPRCR